jgi:FKBP-type peptidyl-prolyl cis-trans isomerase SlyD
MPDWNDNFLGGINPNLLNYNDNSSILLKGEIMQISKNKYVTIDYTLTDDDGQILDTSQDQEPLSYVQGTGQLIPGLEARLEGKIKGDTLQVQIPPEEGYGLWEEEMEQDVPRAEFQAFDDLEVGMQFQVRGEADAMQVVTVTEIQDDMITIDGNHPLAGINLNFAVTVLDVREATPDEIEGCGHDHHDCEGCGGHCH